MSEVREDAPDSEIVEGSGPALFGRRPRNCNGILLVPRRFPQATFHLLPHALLNRLSLAREPGHLNLSLLARPALRGTDLLAQPSFHLLAYPLKSLVLRTLRLCAGSLFYCFDLRSVLRLCPRPPSLIGFDCLLSPSFVFPQALSLSSLAVLRLTQP